MTEPKSVEEVLDDIYGILNTWIQSRNRHFFAEEALSDILKALNAYRAQSPNVRSSSPKE